MDSKSFDKIIESVFDSFKKITPALITLEFISGLILFLPIGILQKMGLDNIPKPIKSVIGILFLFSSILIVVICLSSFYQKIRDRVKKIRKHRWMIKRFTGLSDKHKRIIIEMMESPSRSLRLNSTSGNVIYLKENGYIFQPEQVVDMYDIEQHALIYTPQLWIIDLYNEKPELFKVPTETKGEKP